MARMSETLRTLFTGSGSFTDRLIDLIDELVDPAHPTKHPFRRSFIIEPLEERVVLNVAPVFVDLPDEITVIAGESFHLALNGYDADGDDLVFSTSSNLTEVLTGNNSVRLRIVQRDNSGNIIQDFGTITFELFEGDAPLTTARIKEIIESGFYENKLFHRIIDGFMIQGGSSDGYGTQGTGVTFADEFSELLRHNRNGMVSMANRGPDTNDSQFFITDNDSSGLDDLHSVFGFLTDGYDVLAKVSAVQTQGGGNTNPDKDRPIFDVFMEEIEIFNDTLNGTLRIQTDASMAGTTQYVTVMVDDGNGGQVEQTIKVNVTTLSSNPLFEVPDIIDVKAGESVIVDFPEIAGIPRNQIEYFVDAWENSHPGMKYEITANNQLKITAGADVAGPQYVFFAGSVLYGRGWAAYTTDGYEACFLVVVSPAAPTVNWTAGDNSTDGSGITSNNNKDEDMTLQFTIENLIPTASVELYANGVVMPFTIVSDTYYDADGNEVSSTSQNRMTHTLVIETVGSGEYKLNDGTYDFTVLQHYTSYTYDGYPIPLESNLSTPIRVVVATVAPEFISPPDGFVFDVAPGETLAIDVRTNMDDVGDVTIAFEGEVPEGMTLSADGRQVTWTPTEDVELQEYNVTLHLTDAVGNTRTTTFVVSVQSGLNFVIDGPTEVDEGTTMMIELRPVEPGEDEEPYEGTFTFEIESSTLPEDADMQLIAGEDGRSALFMWATTEADAPGIYTVTFKMTDEEGNSRTKMVQLTVNRLHRPPFFDPDDFEEVYEVVPGDELVINVKAYDNNIPKNVLIYSLLGDDIPDGLTINEQTGKLTWTPSKMYNGQDYDLTILVTDEQGMTATQTITIAVARTNDPPEFTLINPITVWDDHGSLSWTMNAVDTDNMPPNDIRYSLVGDNIPEGMTIDPTTGKVTWNIPADYAGSDSSNLVPYLNLDVAVKATKIIREVVENELGEFETIETEGLSGTYAVNLTIKSRAYEAWLNSQGDIYGGGNDGGKSVTQTQTRSEHNIPGLPGAGLDMMQMRDMPNTPRANGFVETPMIVTNTWFRNRFDRITFGIDSLGSGEVNEAEETPQKPEPEQQSEPQIPTANPGGGYRTNRPISPGAFMRGMESGFSRVSTPLLDALDNIDVRRAVSDARDAGQTISSYYNSVAQSSTSSHDAALRNWDGNAANDLPGGTTPNSGSRDQFRSMRLK